MLEQNNPEEIEEANDIDFQYYGHLLLQNKWQITLLASTITILVTLLVFNMDKIYQSTATLQVEGKQNKILSVEEMFSVDASRNDSLQTQFEILKSPDLIRKVIKKMNLVENIEFTPESTQVSHEQDWKQFFRSMPAIFSDNGNSNLGKTVSSEAEIIEEKTVQKFIKQLTIKPRQQTQLVDVSFTARDPELARKIVNQLCETFIDDGLESRMETTRKAAEWLSIRLEALKEKLMISENKFQNYLSREKLVDLEGVLTITGKEIEENSLRLAGAREARVAAENIYNKIKMGDAETVADVYLDPNVQALKAKETELTNKLSDLTQHYGSEHPIILAAKSELTSLQSSLKNQISIISSGIRNRYEIAKNNELSIISKVEENKLQVQQIGRKQSTLREFQRDTESNRTLYENFFNRFKEANEAAEISASNVRFIDRATKPLEPIKPNKKIIIGLTFVGMLIFGVLLVVVLDYINATIRIPDDVNNKLKMPLLGVFPFNKELSTDSKALSAIVKTDDLGLFSESMGTIRTGLMLSDLDNEHHKWMVTSSFMGEGKSTIASNLAISFAKLSIGDERVLLIETDLRRPTFYKRFDVPNSHPGLTNLLAGNIEKCECVYSYQDIALDIMPAGLIAPNPTELLASKAFENLVEELQREYKTIIFDAPPIHVISDSLLIARHTDSVIFVVKSDDTQVKVIRKGLKLIRRSGTPVVGIVINQIDIKKLYKYDNYYQSEYYNTYA